MSTETAITVPNLQPGVEVRTAEKREGKWVYKKMFACGPMPNAAIKNVPHGLDDLDYYEVSLGDSVFADEEKSLSGVYASPYATTDNMIVYMDKANIILSTGSNRSGFNAYVCLKYTKLSDVADNSPVSLAGPAGEQGPQGVPGPQGEKGEPGTSTAMPEYDLRLGQEVRTNTRYKGRWVYAKLVNFGTLPNTTIKNVAHGLTGMLEYWIDFGRSRAVSGEMSLSPNYPSPDSAMGSFFIQMNKTNLIVKTGMNRSGFTAEICVCFTKASETPVA